MVGAAAMCGAHSIAQARIAMTGLLLEISIDSARHQAGDRLPIMPPLDGRLEGQRQRGRFWTYNQLVSIHPCPAWAHGISRRSASATSAKSAMPRMLSHTRAAQANALSSCELAERSRLPSPL